MAGLRQRKNLGTNSTAVQLEQARRTPLQDMCCPRLFPCIWSRGDLLIEYLWVYEYCLRQGRNKLWFEPFFVYVSSRPRGKMKNFFFFTIIVVVLWNKRTLKRSWIAFVSSAAGYSYWGILVEAECGFFLLWEFVTQMQTHRHMDPYKIFRQHETAKKRQCASRELEVEKASFTP